jgi:hypothetical protein
MPPFLPKSLQGAILGFPLYAIDVCGNEADKKYQNAYAAD